MIPLVWSRHDGLNEPAMIDVSLGEHACSKEQPSLLPSPHLPSIALCPYVHVSLLHTLTYQ
jgi:hypothetical protein